MLEMVYHPTTTIALKFIDLLHNLVISYMKLVFESVGVNGLEHLWAECNRIGFEARACGLQKFMFSDRYHLAAITLARVCLSLNGGSHVMDKVFQPLQDVSFVVAVECPSEGENRILQGRFYYFKCLAIFSVINRCTVNRWTSSTISFFGVEVPFSDEVSPSSIVWCKYWPKYLPIITYLYLLFRFSECQNVYSPVVSSFMCESVKYLAYKKILPISSSQ